MEALDAADLLDVWERGASLGPHERALVLLGHARPDLPDADLGAVPIGRRDTELLRLRRAIFGGRMDAVVSCPSCGEPLELDIDVAAITPADLPIPPDGRVHLTVEGREIAIRVPGTEDLVAVALAVSTGRADGADVRRALLARLVDDGETMAGDEDPGRSREEPDEVADLDAVVGDAILAADPGAEIRLKFDCVACARSWETTLDIASYLWTEIADAARRLASDVAALAATYGWREADVLAMTPWRRRLYLALAAE